MLRLASYDIVFQEIPDEVTLALNLSGCPNRCTGCHSPHLQEDTGKALNEKVLENLLEKYGNAVTCICFMGGDGFPEEVLKLAQFIRRRGEIFFALKTAWYSGKPELYKDAELYFDYIKTGKYMKELGGLNVPTTNQRLYKIENKTMINITNKFYKQ
ncbi:MAG: anaerobic ribonucleoside-triphosphate reductase activating protein [Prevotellaceae bacterium]|jgi:anaerobic ribonucleoside-triphosphate reductase activating protein|nr:anaerobic ribonucleoside-triphosphate reductase activating protein [Prevotellaceae bacterium]